MYGNGMTGAPASRISDFLVPKASFFRWLDSLRESFSVVGPVAEEDRTVFREIASADELHMEYASTMLSPGKVYLYSPREDLFRISFGKDLTIEEPPRSPVQRIIAGIHACDTHAVFYLDRTFLGAFRDPLYENRRSNTMLIALNCSAASRNCFCSSMGAGPFLKAEKGYDMLLTDLEDAYLVEIRTERCRVLFNADATQSADAEVFRRKEEKERSALRTFTKTINTDGLDRALRENPEHPVWGRTADERCLSCANCVMVCPTCFCHDVVDELSMDMKTVRRYREWDACQDARFAEVHGGNFRARRTARLRQFVTHKLDQTHQYGVFGTVGCGRCITWCPTGIDLTEMAKAIQTRKA